MPRPYEAVARLQPLPFLDEDELEPPPQRGGRRSAERQRQLLVRRLIAVGVGVGVVILALLGIRGCLDARKARGFENYARDLGSIADNSRQLSNGFFERLNNPPEDATELDLQSEIAADRGTAEGLLQRVRGLDTPGELEGAQEELTLAFELRRDALETIAEQIPNALGDEGREQAIERIARQMAAFLASDVLYARARGEIQRVLDEEEIEEDAPQSRFLPDPIERYLDDLQLAALLAGFSPNTGEAATLRGVELVGTTLSPPGIALSPESLNSAPLRRGSELSVDVQNVGESQESDVSVRFSLSGGPEAIEGSSTIESIAAGGVGTATLPIRPQPPTGSELALTVTVAPVPGETMIENNRSTYPVTFD
jgi:hypothetical protein